MLNVSSYTLIHDDHDLTDDQVSFVFETVKKGEGFTVLAPPNEEGGEFFILPFSLPEELGTMPCALYGESQGDVLDEDEVFLLDRNGRGYEDRMIDRPFRPVSHGQAIGLINQANGSVLFFTIFGGDLAPKHPAQCEGEELEHSRAWWSKHALATGNC